jgi:hypothetical protein
MAKPNPQSLKFDISEDDKVTGGEAYIGDLPPAHKALAGVISKIYVTSTFAGDPILKVLYTATEDKYAGFTAWDNVTITAKAAFKWKPLVRALGISVMELATETVTDPEDESDAGIRVIRIGKLDLSGDNTVPVYFGVKYRKYDEVMQTDVAAVRPRGIATNGVS